jgi:hypothetical protein
MMETDENRFSGVGMKICSPIKMDPRGLPHE